MSTSRSSSSFSVAQPDVGKLVNVAKVLGERYPNNNDIKPFDFRIGGFTCCPCLGFVWQCVMIATFGSFLFGFNLSLLNTSIKAININYGWCDVDGNGAVTSDCTTATNYTAFLSTAIFIGAAVGSMTGGKFLGLGRRNCLILSMIIFMFGIVDSCVSNSFPALLWARLVVGYAVGVVSVVSPMYIAEMAPRQKRGTYGVMHQMLITVGIFVAVLIGLPFDSPDGSPDWEQPMFDKVWWRVMLGLAIVPVCACAYLLTFTYKFETPHYYVEKKQYDDAVNLLSLIYPADQVAEELKVIEDGLEDAERAKREGLTFMRAINDPDYRMVIIFGFLLSAFQQLTGINVFIASSNELFEEAGFEGTIVTAFSTVMTGVNFLMTFPALYLIESLGRKTLLITSTVGQLVGVLPAAICYWVDEDSDATRWLAIAGAIVFIFFFAVGYGPVLWVFLFEIYPAEIKGVASGLATAVNWIAGIVMVFVTTYLENKISYTLFAAMCAVAVVLEVLFMKETRGRSIDDSPYMKSKKAVDAV